MQLIRSEQTYWRSVLTRLVAIICHLAERKLAFRGSTDKLDDPQNGNFLGQVELLAKFDPIMNEHLCRIGDKQINYHYLSKDIQNELVCLIGNKIVRTIVEKVHKSKYHNGLHTRHESH